MESAAHQQLKRLALAFLAHHGCAAVAAEVRCPISRYRVDVAGYLDHRPVAASAGGHAAAPFHDRSGAMHAAGVNGHHRCLVEPRTVVIECKQSREDFIRNLEDVENLIRERERLQARQQIMEQSQIRAHEPHLRRSGSSLFPELEIWDFARSRMSGYRKLLRRLRQIDEVLYGQAKFCMLARYRLADRLYLAAPAGMIKPRELPAGWGLLECSRRCFHDPPRLFDWSGPPKLRVTAVAPEWHAPPKFRHRLLRNIAVAATRAALDQMH